MDLLDHGVRKKIIDQINADENKQQKYMSFKQSQVQNDKIYQYIYENLEAKYDTETVNEMTVIANINLQRRISKQEASIYKKAPNRQYSDLNDNQIDVIEKIYSDAKANTMLRKANEIYKYQQQSCLQLVPMNGKLCFRPLKRHHYDVVPDKKNPEVAAAYVLSDFDYTDAHRVRRDDRTSSRSNYSQGDVYRDGVNQKIADFDDAKDINRVYTWWSDEYNFFTNGKGEILDKEKMEPIRDRALEDADYLSPLIESKIMPFVDIASEKEFQFFVEQGSALYDATIVYNTMLTEENEVVEMQGYAQAYYKGSADQMPENLKVGTRKVIFIPQDPNNPVQSEFNFVSPNADLSSIKEFRESYLATFLSSRGVDISSVTSSRGEQNPTDISRLIKMIEKFEASQEDMDIFEEAESNIFDIIKAWLKSLSTSDILDNKYKTSIPDDAEIMVEFAKPESVQTEIERLDIVDRKMEKGLMSRVDALMELENIDIDMAKERLKEIDEMEFAIEGRSIQAQVQQEGNLPEIQSEEVAGQDTIGASETSIL